MLVDQFELGAGRKGGGPPVSDSEPADGDAPPLAGRRDSGAGRSGVTVPGHRHPRRIGATQPSHLIGAVGPRRRPGGWGLDNATSVNNSTATATDSPLDRTERKESCAEKGSWPGGCGGSSLCRDEGLLRRIDIEGPVRCPSQSSPPRLGWMAGLSIHAISLPHATVHLLPQPWIGSEADGGC